MAILRTELIERDDHWILPFAGLSVTQIQIDFNFLLQFDDVGTVRISNKMTLGSINVSVGPEVELEPERQDVAAGLGLFNVVVTSAFAFKSGALRIVFDDGHVLNVDPDPDYEAWTATGPDGMLIVSLPGGDLAVWSPRPRPK